MLPPPCAARLLSPRNCRIPTSPRSPPASTLPLESFPGSPRITPDLGWGGGRLSRRKIGQECRWDPGLEETLCGGRRPLLSADAGWGSAWCGEPGTSHHPWRMGSSAMRLRPGTWVRRLLETQGQGVASLQSSQGFPTHISTPLIATVLGFG